MMYELGETPPYQPMKEAIHDEEFHIKLKAADIILAIDRHTSAPYAVFWGENALKEVSRDEGKHDRQRTVIVPIDTTPEDDASDDCSDTALLVVMLEELKGHATLRQKLLPDKKTESHVL
jgi:hypothetical protein